MSKISIYPYQLKKKWDWGRHHEGKGALLRLTDEDGNHGYSDIHPWMQLGDLSLSKQLQILKEGQPLTSLLTRSLFFAKEDLNLRVEKIPITTFSSKIQNHITLLNLEVLESGDEPNFLKKIRENQNPLNGLNSVNTLKVKMGIDLKKEAQLLNEFVKENKKSISDLKLRLDFNALANYEEIIQFWSSLNEDVQSCVEFLEDPIPWNINEWEELKFKFNIPLAIDRAHDFLKRDDSEAKSLSLENSPLEKALFDFIVIKPAVQDWRANQQVLNLLREKKLKAVFTSYLDHPVGILHARLEAQRFSQDEKNDLAVCGLNTLGVYDLPVDLENSLQKQWEQKSNHFGIGLDPYLESLDWQAWV